MYHSILITLDATNTDRAILEHIKPLARMMHSRVILLHVADGWAARTFGKDAISQEVDDDRAYLETVRQELLREGIVAEAELAYGEPADEIVRWIEKCGCDLLAMSTHGHRFLGDSFLGATAHNVQHRVTVPVLLLRAKS